MTPLCSQRLIYCQLWSSGFFVLQTSLTAGTMSMSMSKSETSSLLDTVQICTQPSVHAYNCSHVHIQAIPSACPRYCNLIALNLPSWLWKTKLISHSDPQSQNPTYQTTPTNTPTPSIPSSLCHAPSTSPDQTLPASAPPASTTSTTSSHASQASSKHKPSHTMFLKSISPNSSRLPLLKPSSKTKTP